jgi:hypothetical protein
MEVAVANETLAAVGTIVSLVGFPIGIAGIWIAIQAQRSAKRDLEQATTKLELATNEAHLTTLRLGMEVAQARFLLLYQEVRTSKQEVQTLKASNPQEESVLKAIAELEEGIATREEKLDAMMDKFAEYYEGREP